MVFGVMTPPSFGSILLYIINNHKLKNFKTHECTLYTSNKNEQGVMFFD